MYSTHHTQNRNVDYVYFTHNRRNIRLARYGHASFALRESILCRHRKTCEEQNSIVHIFQLWFLTIVKPGGAQPLKYIERVQMMYIY